MHDLKLVGLSEDGQRVIFVDDAGVEFASPADDRLRAVLKRGRARQGQLEIEMDSALRPRDIQARIRAGESAESVAALAQVSVDRIMGYAVPVLAERQHIAETAQRCPVRRKNAEGPARRLADVVDERLRGRNVDVTTAEWDAWRRDDGRWAVQATYQSGERERKALFVFDAMGRYSLADDDEAKWLTGEKQLTRKGPQPREAGAKPGKPGDRRLAAVKDEDDLLSLTGDEYDEEYTDDLTAVVRAVEETGAGTAEAPADTAEAPADTAEGPADTAEGPADESAYDDDDTVEPEYEDLGSEEIADRPDEYRPEPVESSVPEATDEAASQGDVASQDATERTPERRRKDRRRASIPSWDEIMFGKGDDAK